jgi:SAM-dependent methyltransferase
MEQTLVNLGKKYLPHDLRMALRRVNWKMSYIGQGLFSTAPPGGVHCCIADRDFHHFIQRKGDLLSPSNGAHGRQRLVWHFLKEEIGILRKPMRVLHVAPEVAFMEILREQPHLDYLPGDKMVDGYSNQQGVRNLDLTALDLPADSVDLVICNHVLEHIPDDAAAMREMYRVLRKGGRAVITVPVREELERTYEDPSITTPAQRRIHFGQWDHVRFYGLDLRERLAMAGFQVEVVRYGERFTPEEYRRLGFCKDVIFLATKA